MAEYSIAPQPGNKSSSQMQLAFLFHFSLPGGQCVHVLQLAAILVKEVVMANATALQLWVAPAQPV